ncbi:CHAD domain-containing protein [Acaryochloris sp. IP29b_bin.137]|uniref:CHAD domain-containing protein n=1 Tax=Acaryochloris sp. IP29b_bin.137 TaxID=2969217 RepID=UPI00261FFCA1|nr:CHAD domain-containing protein [Acaryochloris sp. IP29b_bin.137]
MKTRSSSSTKTSKKKKLTFDGTFSLGQVAHRAIQKHFKKSTKYQEGVLADQDPEYLHQMRVGMRRLRTAIDVFAPAIDLPVAAQRSRITKIAKRLGQVRDLDVLQLWFQHFLAITSVDEAESKQIQWVLARLSKRRQKKFAQLPKLFKSKEYRQFVATYDQWLKTPQFQAVATMPALDAVPDLLLPLLSQLFLHPGWLVATETLEGRLYPVMGISMEALDVVFATEGPALHDLRKQMKRVRYQTEFFIPFFGKPYQTQTQGFRALQELLGLFQDEAVLSEFLAGELGPAWTEQLPSLASLLQEERFRNWKKWQSVQRKYLDPKFRRTLSRRVMSPSLELNLA